jgi:putative hemolysin
MSSLEQRTVRNIYHLSRKKFIFISDSRYVVKLAETVEEVDAALRLRFEVFNLEMKEGLDASFFTLRDEDGFDQQCHHLIVIEKVTGSVIGTYRMQTLEMARSGLGFYSATEFELNKLGWLILMRSVELGRACISKKHRNGRVLFLLWKGIGQYMQVQQKRFLFGCCSLNSQDPAQGTLLMRQLIQTGRTVKNIKVNPKSGFECYRNDPASEGTPVDVLPPLMEMYFRYGAKVCSFPAIDREFKTIDFLVVLDSHELEEETHKTFFWGTSQHSSSIPTGQ